MHISSVVCDIYASRCYSCVSCVLKAVTIMTEWLREHQENPYPNDDEKESLIASTKLTINQINYWFTNARRRILPKWALQRHLDEQEKTRLAGTGGTYNDSRATSSPVS